MDMETNTPNKGKGDEIINSVENKYVNGKLNRRGGNSLPLAPVIKISK